MKLLTDRSLFLHMIAFLPDAEVFLHCHRFSRSANGFVASEPGYAHLYSRLPQATSLLSRNRDRLLLTSIYLHLQQAAQRIFDPCRCHEDHFSICCATRTTDVQQHQPFSFRSLPRILQVIIVEHFLCGCFQQAPSFDASISASDISQPPCTCILQMVGEAYSLSTFAGLSLSSRTRYGFAKLQSAYDWMVEEEMLYRGEHMMLSTESDTSLTARRQMTREFGSPAYLFPEGIVELVYELGSSTFVTDTIPSSLLHLLPDSPLPPDDWMVYLLQTTQDRGVLWFASSKSGQFIGVLRRDFDTLMPYDIQHGSSKSSCLCQSDWRSTPDWNDGPLIYMGPWGNWPQFWCQSIESFVSLDPFKLNHLCDSNHFNERRLRLSEHLRARLCDELSLNRMFPMSVAASDKKVVGDFVSLMNAQAVRNCFAVYLPELQCTFFDEEDGTPESDDSDETDEPSLYDISSLDW